jgi:hypothetical protein
MRIPNLSVSLLLVLHLLLLLLGGISSFALFYTFGVGGEAGSGTEGLFRLMPVLA